MNWFTATLNTLLRLDYKREEEKDVHHLDFVVSTARDATHEIEGKP